MTRTVIIAIFALALVLVGASVVFAQGTTTTPGAMMQGFDAEQMQQRHDQMMETLDPETRALMEERHAQMLENGGPGGMMRNMDAETWQKMQDAMANGDWQQMHDTCQGQPQRNGDGGNGTTGTTSGAPQTPPASTQAGGYGARSRMM